MKWFALVCFLVNVHASLAFSQAVGLNGAVDNSKWMQSLPDSTNIASLSIPGSHNSFTYSWPLGNNPIIPMSTCQAHMIQEQLKAGVRFVDIRLKMKNTIGGRLFRVVHGLADTSLTSDEAFLYITRFLDSNPSEVVLARVSKDYGDATSTEEFDYVFKKKYWPYSTSDKYTKRFYKASLGESLNSRTLGSLRGKIVLLYEGWGSGPEIYGFSYNAPYISKMDNYVINNAADMDRKYSETVSHVTAASNGNSNLYLTYISGSISSAGGFFGLYSPRTVAEGLQSVEGQNARTTRFLTALKAQPGTQKCGVIMMDFPSTDLVQSILLLNTDN